MMLFMTELDLVRLKSGVAYTFSHYFEKIKVDTYDSLPIEKRLTSHVIILIKPVPNKHKNHYFYEIFSEKYSYELAKK